MSGGPGGEVPESKPASYEAAGVSIAAGNRAVSMMRAAVEATHGPQVVPLSGGFAGLYALAGYEEPVLASTIDGVGTKVLVASEVGGYASIGADIVNHCANDVLATGARPLLFLDYVASGRLDPENVSEVVRGAAGACRELGVALVGGETAEMPGLYSDSQFDVVGMCLGACERSQVVTGEQVAAGDAVIGLAASGLHTNGYTLARRVLSDAGIGYGERPEGLNRTVGEEYLEPHRAYVKQIAALRDEVEVRGLAHITGGGLVENLPRALGNPPGNEYKKARLEVGSWKEPGVFALIRALGNVPETEMRRVFNLGVGFCAIVPDSDLERAVSLIQQTGCEAWRIGTVEESTGGNAGDGGAVEFV